MNYQKVIIVGNATNDAKSRKSKNGDVTFTTFNVSVRNSKKSTSYFPVVAFGFLCVFTAKYVKKGKPVLVEGRLEMNEDRINVIATKIELGVQGGKFSREQIHNPDIRSHVT